MDHRGEVFAVSKWVEIKTKEVRTRLTDEKNLPSVEEARIQIAKNMTAQLETLSQEQMTVFATRRAELEEKRQALVGQYQAERQKLTETQQSFWQNTAACCKATSGCLPLAGHRPKGILEG